MLRRDPPIRGAIEQLFKRQMRISQEETRLHRRGFTPASDAARESLESAGAAFLRGYHAALGSSDGAGLARELDRELLPTRGFGYEGAGMALALLELLLPWRRGGVAAFLAGPGQPHTYLIHVGVGWALARLGRGERDLPAGLDPLLRWLAFDGYGFHEGYFHPRRVFQQQRRPRVLSGYALRAFDQGLGRSLWFAAGADPARAVAMISEFAAPRHGDLWSGVGLAAAYAGGSDEVGIPLLARAAGPYTSHLAQGVAFAATAREAAGTPAECTELACRAVCHCPSRVAARWPVEARAGLFHQGDLPDYEVWRQRVRSGFHREDPSA